MASSVASAAGAKQIMDMAHAAKVFALRQKATDAAKYAHSIEIEAMRVMGRFLKAEPKNPGTRTKGGDKRSGGTILEPPETPTLAAMAISKKEAASAQHFAVLAEQKPWHLKAVAGAMARQGCPEHHGKMTTATDAHLALICYARQRVGDDVANGV